MAPFYIKIFLANEMISKDYTYKEYPKKKNKFGPGLTKSGRLKTTCAKYGSYTCVFFYGFVNHGKKFDLNLIFKNLLKIPFQLI